jgi:hypothetical protein
MTIAELLARIGLAFERTYYLVVNGAFGDVVLWDLGIIVVVSIVGLVALLVGLVSVGVAFASSVDADTPDR